MPWVNPGDRKFPFNFWCLISCNFHLSTSYVVWKFVFVITVSVETKTATLSNCMKVSPNQECRRNAEDPVDPLSMSVLYFFRLLLWFVYPNSQLLRSCRRILIWTARTSLSGWSLANQSVAYHPAGILKCLSVSWIIIVNVVKPKDVFKDVPNNSSKTFGSCSSC